MKTNWIFSKKTVCILSAVIVLYSLAGFFLIPLAGKNIMQDKLGSLLHREVTIKKISFNPFTLSAEINGLTVKKKKVFFSISKIHIDLSIISLLTLTPVVSDFSIKKPYLNIVRNKDGSFNFSDISGKFVSEDKNSGKNNNNSEGIPAFVIKNIVVNQGEIKFEDRLKNVSHIVKNISILLPFLNSKKPYRYDKTKLNINFILNQAKFNIQAELTPFAESPTVTANVKTANINLVHYLPYLSIPENISVKSLGINCDIRADFKKEKSKNSLLLQGEINALNADINGIDQKKIIKIPALNLDVSKSDVFAGRLNISKLSIQSLSVLDSQSKEEMINIPEFKIMDSSIDLGKKTINMGEMITKNGKILVKRSKDGRINLIRSAVAEAASQKDHNTSEEKTSSEKKLSWNVSLNSFDASGFNVVFKDLTNQAPVSINLSDISIRADNIKNYGVEKGHIALNMNFNDNGRINVKGSLIPSILSADLDIDLKKIDIKSFQPYFADSVRVLVTDGDIQAKGQLKLHLKDTGKGKTKFDFKGQTSINNFICLDGQSAEDFFKCNSLYLAGLDASVFPVKIRIKDVSLTDFYSRIIINKKGVINLNTIFKKKAEDIPPGKGVNNSKTSLAAVPVNKREKQKINSTASDIKIKNVTLQGGKIIFSDYSINPGFTADMKKIAGSLTDLSSAETSRAILQLQGIHGQSSPLEIKGKINPLAENKFADIKLSFKDIELANFSPYSSKYLGYKIDRGKLTLDLKYLIDGNKLSSENKIDFDNLTLGDRVKSDKATSLPVSLAISLLKNRKGQIDLDLPVKGELNDPKFKISSIVFKMISNLIVKVVTSPFSIIGSMFGGGEELAYVNFKYGETKIDASNYKKINTIAEILRDKHSVKLEIRGYYDKIRDYEALKMKKFHELLKAEKLRRMLAAGSDAKTLTQVNLKKQDMDSLINAVYARAKFPKPMDNKGHKKPISVEEKKKLLITNIHIRNDDLRSLAMKRSEDIKAYLVSKEKIEKKRIFLLEPKAADDTKKKNTSQVQFSLK